MYGGGQGVTTLRARLFDLEDELDAYVIKLESSAPDGVIIQDMTLDGRKHETEAPDAEGDDLVDMLRLTTAITLNGGSPVSRDDGIIRRVEIKDFLFKGVEIVDVADWTIEDNYIHGIGCHVIECHDQHGTTVCTGDEPCGPGWPDTVPDLFGSPNRKTDGYGIVVNTRSTDVTVENNEIEHMTKVAIATFGSDAPPCDDPVNPPPLRTSILDNTVSYSQAGILLNGCCDSIVEDNVASHMIATGGEESNRGYGFGCTDGGSGSRWRRNLSEYNQGAGYWIGCASGDIIFEDNEANNNCQTTEHATADFHFAAKIEEDDNEEPIPVEGLAFVNNTSTSSNLCTYGLQIVNYDDVCVMGGSIEGSGVWDTAVRLSRIDGLNMDELELGGADFGVRFDFDSNELHGPLANVYVQDTTEVSNVKDDDVVWEDGRSANDGDSVAFCELETSTPPSPQGCANLPDPHFNYECAGFGE
jgi:hypothetical protein